MKMVEAFQGLDLKPGERIQMKIFTPKASDHGYLKSYENHFKTYRNHVKTFCELGVSRGASLIAWKRYFPNAHIVGIDNDAATSNIENLVDFAHGLIGEDSKDISIEIGDALDKEFLKSIAEKYGGFDIVLDDCSHIGIQMQRSFEALWEYTRFLYVVEDLQTQFAEGRKRHGLNFSKDRKYNEDGNFITDCLQNLVTEEILPINIKDKMQFSSTRDDISDIITENFIAFIYKGLTGGTNG